MYFAMSVAGATWQWLMGQPSRTPEGLEFLLLLRPALCLMFCYITWGTVRVARKEAERLNIAIVIGLLILTVLPLLLLKNLPRH